MQCHKKIALIITFANILLLPSCQTGSDTRFILPKFIVSDYTNNIKSFTKELTTPLYESLTYSQSSFVLYVGDDNCHYCQNLNPLIYNYYVNNLPLIYYVDFSGETWSQISATDESLKTPGTPTLFFFDKGELIHKEIGTGKLKNEVDVAKLFKKYIILNNYYVSDDFNGVNFDKCIGVSFDSNNKELLTFFNNNIYKYAANKNNYIYTLPYSDGDDLIIAFNYGEISYNLTYALSGEEAINEALQQFFEN